MEEKKRVRPTWAQVRELEGLVVELKEKYNALLKIEETGHDALVEESASMSRELVELRRKLDEQMEGTSRLVKDCDDWREKYRVLSEKCAGLGDIETHCKSLEDSNVALNQELDKYRESNVELGKKCAELSDEIERMRSRGFWARVFNK